ncbi:hypothetical protein [Jiella sp. M17.18]|uniref:hypothetical protein n=1 Tax=Jiella sp. M17.18 TaxID=3234247 RepID=UPI0034DEE461
MNLDSLSDEELLYLVGTTDKELFDAGRDIRQRDWEVPNAVMKKLGYASFVIAGAGTPVILERIRAIFASIYRSQDLAVGGHIGVFMYRDVFARFSIPHCYGRVSINPFDFVDLTRIQLRMIQVETEEYSRYIDQFCDVADIQYGLQKRRRSYKDAEVLHRFLGLSRLHLHAAAAILTGGYDYRGAVQAGLLATELALKAGAAASGLTEREIKDRFAHKVAQTAQFLGDVWPSFDVARVQRVIAGQPPYVINRYSAEQPNRRDVGHLVMGAQFIVSEVVRQTSDQDFRRGLKPLVARSYPE